MYSVILCGGSGTRLWPLSRKNFPKQFLKLYGDHSLLQETYLRVHEIIPAEKIFFSTNQDNFYNVRDQIKELDKNFDDSRIIIEPAGRNTAPAITLAMKYLIEKKSASGDEPVVFLPADHYISNKGSFLKTLTEAGSNVNNNIGTIGITPTAPETGFGYIQKGDHTGTYFKATAFKEKPDLETAKQYLASGEYVWNAGIYIFSAKAFVSEIKLHSPEIYKFLNLNYEDFTAQFTELPDISIDYAISEKSNKVIIFESDFGWSDIGSFDSLAEIIKIEKKPKGNLLAIDAKNVFAHSTSNRFIAAIGIDNINIIESSDSILVQKHGHSEDVKKVVKYLKENNCKEINDSLIGYRPWGTYEILIDTPTYKVKKITVYPGAKLSLQAHYHRAEHLVVVKGVATVTNGDDIITLRENESTFIRSYTRHRLENPGKINLELIEVQTGNYMEEDDIVRFEDIYNR